MSIFIGIEGGATRATALATDTGGRTLARVATDAIVVRGGDQSATANDLARLVARVLSEAGGVQQVRAISCNLTGAGRPDERSALHGALSALGLGAVLHIGTDAEAALADAFEEGPGLLLIAGTGSIAWGRGPLGNVERVGGWGPIAGDEGSAWAIGRAALQAVFAAFDGRTGRTSLTQRVIDATGVEDVPMLVRWAETAGKKGVAGLAPIVIDEAHGDEVATHLLDRALHDLGLHVIALAARLEPWHDPIPVAFGGGLLAHGRPLRDAVRVRLATLLPSVLVVERDVDGARGAAWLARRLGQP